MNDEVKINPKVHTSCKNCFFAVYDDKTQVGCDINFIDKYKKISDHIVLECYDEDLEFYVINNKICLYYIDKSRLLNDITKEELYQAIRNHIKIRYHALILINNSSKEDLETTVVSLRNQVHPPLLLTMIRLPESSLKGSEIVNVFNNVYKDAEQVPEWRIQNSVNQELTTPDYIDICVDGTKTKLYNFYCVFNTGCNVPKNFGSKIDKIINDDLTTFFLIKGNKDGNGMVVPLMIHKRYSGNSHGVYLETKVEADLCDQSKILKINQLFPKLF